MVQIIMQSFRKSVTTELPSFSQNIITSTEFSMQTKTFHCTLNNRELALQVIQPLWNNKTEVEVAVIMVDSSTTGLAAHQVSPIGFKGIDIHLTIGILVLPYHHCTVVFPQIQYNGIGIFHKIIFDSNIPIGIGLVRNKELCNHLKFIY